MTDQVEKLAPEILATIQTAKKILLHFHPNPDPDSVGSALAMAHALRGLGKEVTVIKGDSPMPNYLNFLPGYETIVPKSYLEINPADYDLFLILDISQPDRITNLGKVNFPSTLKTILIDHHKSATPFAEINLIDASYPATAQILFDLFTLWKINFTPEIASCLFLGLYTDTGGFKYPGTKPETFLAAGTLARFAPNFPELVSNLENNNTPNQLKFESLAFRSIEVISGKVALVALAAKDLLAEGLRPEDGKGVSIPNRLRSVKGWEIGALLLEDVSSGAPLIRLSMRARDGAVYDVSRLAVALGGGGHAAAAGAALKMSLAEAKKLFLEKLFETYPVLSA